MRIDDGGQVDPATLDSILQHGCDPVVEISTLRGGVQAVYTARPYSSGFAGSMTTASLVLSSMSR